MKNRPLQAGLSLVAAFAIFACVRKQQPPVARAAPPSELLDTLFVLATGTRPDADERAARDARIASGELSLAGYVDSLVADTRFSRVVVPRLLYKIAATQYSQNGFTRIMVLEHSPDASGTEIYDSPDHGPCKPADVVGVHPWWAPTTEVKICSDAYRPDVWVDGRFARKEKPPTECDSAGSVIRPAPFACGAGPMLQRAARDDEHYNELRTSARNEVIRTTAWAVENDLPVKTIFTTNATWRDRNAEYIYRLWDAEAHHRTVDMTGLDDWPADGKLAPRAEETPGMHAGVLTAPHLVYFFSDRRQRMKELYQILWCSGSGSSGAKAEDLLSLGSGNLQVTNDGWKILAAKPICTECHARLDYGSRFFWGFEDANATATHFVPASQLPGAGPLYGASIDDPRGEAPLTPQGFVSLALEQPEFRSCMVDDVVSHVFGAKATSDDRNAVSDAYQRKGTFREMARVALSRFARDWSPDDVQLPDPADVVAGGDAGTMTVGPALRAQLDQKCGSCHDGQTSGAPDFGAATLPRDLAVKMLDSVAFGSMPKGNTRISDLSRRAVVSALVESLWSDPKDRAIAQAHFSGDDDRTLSAYGIDTALDVVGSLSGAPPPAKDDWRMIERGIAESSQRYDPGYVAITGLAAIDACKRAGKTGPALDECLRRATDPMVLSRYPAPAPTPAVTASHP